MRRKNGLEPIPGFNSNTKVLILGSLPGEESLAAGEYYANKKNLFWRIMSEVLSQTGPTSYKQKKALLRKFNICLWDVVQSCYRKGSLDQNIEAPIMNKIDNKIKRFPNIKAIFLNGKKSGVLLNRNFPNLRQDIHVEVLPSTSPTNTRMTYKKKVRIWRRILKFIKIR